MFAFCSSFFVYIYGVILRKYLLWKILLDNCRAQRRNDKYGVEVSN